MLRRQSTISTSAGVDGAGGDGGNISIKVPSGFIVAVEGENSDITANAFSGSGGERRIRALDLFGIAPLSREELQRLRPEDSDPKELETNDITAVSQRNPVLSGIVEINQGNLEQNLVLPELPVTLTDSTALVDTSCAAFAEGNESSFTVTGKGGLPPTPYDPLTTDVIWTDERVPNIASLQVGKELPLSKPQLKVTEVTPATGWIFTDNGEVMLISHTKGLPPNSTTCHNLSANFNSSLVSE